VAVGFGDVGSVNGDADAERDIRAERTKCWGSIYLLERQKSGYVSWSISLNEWRHSEGFGVPEIQSGTPSLND
jgi:hypothetical protein